MVHFPGHMTNFNKFKRTAVIQSMFFDQNGMDLKISNVRKHRKITNMWKLDNIPK